MNRQIWLQINGLLEENSINGSLSFDLIKEGRDRDR